MENKAKMVSKQSRKAGARKFKKNSSLLLMCVPAILFFFMFNYVPMPGIYVAFINFNYRAGIFASEFVGWENFRFLGLTGDLPMLIRNTVLYNMAFIVIGNVVQIAMALMLNEIRKARFRKISQSIMILPHFISYVIVGLFAYNILNFEFGILNTTLKAMGMDTVKIYSNPKAWPTIIVITNLWKTTGYGTIVYFAAIMNINVQMIEASEIDGANIFQRTRYIMLPCLKPTFIILLLFSLGGILKGNFGLMYNMVGARNQVLFETTDIIETYVFRAMMSNFNFATASTVGFVQSIFGFLLVLGANGLVRRTEPEYSLF